MKVKLNSNANLCTRIALDGQMRILEIQKLNEPLFFGKCLVCGKTLIDFFDKDTDDMQQIEIIISGLSRALKAKRNTCFEYLSTNTDSLGIYVCAYVEYCNANSLFLHLSPLNADGFEPTVGECQYLQLQKEYDKLKNQNVVIFDSLLVGVAIYAKNGDLLYLNKAMSDIFGVNREEILKAQLNLNDHPLLPKEIKEAVYGSAPVEIRIPYDFDVVSEKKHLKTENRKIRELACSGQPIMNAYGVVDNYVFIINDVTESVQYERQLHSNKRKIELAMHTADIMIWEFDVRKQLFYSDNEPLNGYDNTKPLTIFDYTSMVHPDDLNSVSEIINRMCAGEDFAYDFDARVQYPNISEWQYCAINLLPYEKDDKGKVVKYVGTRKNDTKLQRKKVLQETILNSIPVSVHLKDIENDSRYIFCNDESKQMFGTSENKTSHDVVDAEEVERIRKTDLEVFNTGKSYLGFEHIVLKDQRMYDVVVRKSIIVDEDKRLLLSVRWDQGLQNELRRNSKLLLLTLESMNAFTWFYEPDKELLRFGDGFEKMGKEALKIYSLDTFIDHVHPDDSSPFLRSLEAIIVKGNGSWGVEYRMDLNGDGNYTWWEARGIIETNVLNDISYQHMYGLSLNIELHKQTELTLLKNKKKLKALICQNELILNNTNSGLAYITPDFIVQWENISKCSASLSYEAYKKGDFCYKTAHNRTEPCENCVLKRAFQSRQMEQIQFSLDNNHTVEIFATPVLREDGSIDGIVIRVDDITEREQMISELNCAKILAEQSDKLKSAFLANMSHEIRTPLNAIVGFSGLLMDTNPEEDRQEFIRIINNNNELLLKLINDILDLSKLESGLIELKYEEFDLNEYIDEVVLSLKHRITNNNIRLIIEKPYSSCWVTLDKNCVTQILTNYITNAIKYTPKGFIEVGYECLEDEIRLYVKDSGIGIPNDKKDKVFHRFAKLDEFAQGTGLGLSICKAIVESMEGRIGFESNYGEGSLFWVILPCRGTIKSETKRIDGQLELDAECVKNENEAKRKTILIAEDTQSNYLLISSLLKKYFNLLHAENGLEAVEMLKIHQVDLMLTDMKMPVMTGLEAVAEIRKFDCNLPIIALTAHAFEADKKAALAVGCNEYLVKPINKDHLMDVLRQYCFFTENI